MHLGIFFNQFIGWGLIKVLCIFLGIELKIVFVRFPSTPIFKILYPKYLYGLCLPKNGSDSKSFSVHKGLPNLGTMELTWFVM